jgi:ketosteroid isomerase-like protein
MTTDDYFAIQNLVYSYCHRIDRGDFAGVGELFAHADIIVPASAAPVRGAQAIHDMYATFTRRYPDGNTPKTAHVTSNLIIEADGADAARAQSYFLVHQATEALPLQPIIGGRYFDRFARVAGAWRFSERRIEIDLMGNLSAHMLQGIDAGGGTA